MLIGLLGDFENLPASLNERKLNRVGSSYAACWQLALPGLRPERYALRTK